MLVARYCIQGAGESVLWEIRSDGKTLRFDKINYQRREALDCVVSTQREPGNRHRADEVIVAALPPE